MCGVSVDTHKNFVEDCYSKLSQLRNGQDADRDINAYFTIHWFMAELEPAESTRASIAASYQATPKLAYGTYKAHKHTDDNWKETRTCHHCGVKGHLRPACKKWRALTREEQQATRNTKSSANLARS